MDGVKWYHALLFLLLTPIWAAAQARGWPDLEETSKEDAE